MDGFSLADFELDSRMDACPACASTAIEFAFESTDTDWSIAGFDIDECLACDTRFLNPQPTKETLDRFYKRLGDRDASAQTDASYLNKSLNNYLDPDKRATYKEGLLDPIREERASGKLLDFGCGAGWFVRLASDHGFDAHGIDVNPQLIEEGGDRLDLETLEQGDEESVPQDEFDVVTAFSVIEHVRDPFDLLETLAGALTDDGILVLKFPTVDSLAHRYFEEDFYWVMAPYHLTLFSKRGMRTMADRANVQVDAIKPYRYTWKWTYSLAQQLEVTDAYSSWRDDPAFVEFDIALDELLDDIAYERGETSAILAFCRPE
jgi:2-polyprenyl-3-methyl-5-hydroxy-6-metoxy-1,4-benzoquinol methylase